MPADEVAPAVAARRDELVLPSGFRALPDDSLHMTVVFIGEVDAGQIKEVLEAGRWAAEGHRPFGLALTHQGGLHVGPTRVWVLRGVCEPFADLVAQGRRHLSSFGEVPRQTRRPVAHVTVGRAREAVGAPTSLLIPPIALEVRSLVLYESRLSAQGASYIALGRFPLGA